MTINGFFGFDSLTPYTHHSEVKLIIALSLIYTLRAHRYAQSVLSFHLSYRGNGFITVLLSLQQTWGLFSSLFAFLSYLPVIRLPSPKALSVLHSSWHVILVI
jgi:hypothetical protein